MCVNFNSSVPSTTTVSKKELNEKVVKNLNEPLNLNLPDLPNPYANGDTVNFKPKPNVPPVPVYGHDNDFIRLTEYSPTSAKIELGTPNEKALLTIKARNEITYQPNGIPQEDSKVSFNSPYLRDKARDYARDAVMDTVVTPMRGALGKTVADTTLGAAVVATAIVSAKHLPDGHAKVDIPIRKLTGNDDLRTKLILGYGDGSNLKATGVEISNKYSLGNYKQMDVKVSYRKDAEINGFRGAEETKLETVIGDSRRRWDDGVLSASIGHNSVTGTTASLFYSKQF
ncbi:MAG: hypothetical protein U0457_11330 [Candidatus Sericytochromatia bacterium]